MVKTIKNKKILIFQNLHENLNQKADSISEKVPKLDFEGPGPQNPQNVVKFSKMLLKILYIYPPPRLRVRRS